jgi:acetylornithine deacetylase/succinyl-diaminopimelate desuccinylase family protein
MPPLAIDHDYLTRTLADLIRINSINPSLVPGGAGEAEIATCVADALRHIGLDAATHEPEPGRISVVGKLKGRGGGRSMMLNAHMDTVGIGNMPDPFSATIRNGRMYGRGAYDMKGSLAACLTAAKALTDAGIALGGDLIVAAVADEEYASLGTADVIKHYNVDAAVVTEATELNLCLAHKGFIWLEVETTGRAAHGSRFDEGIDANMRMGRFLAELDQLEKELRARRGHFLVGPPSLHAATLTGGTELSMYAARCKLQIERRTVPGETEALVVGELQAILNRLAAADPTFEATLKTLLVRAPYSVAPEAAIVKAVGQAASRVLGREPDYIGQPFWMDAALLSAAGVETVVIGPIGAGAHAREEWVDLQSLAHLAHILAQTAVEYCR